jgi:hypothetical protein
MGEYLEYNPVLIQQRKDDWKRLTKTVKTCEIKAPFYNVESAVIQGPHSFQGMISVGVDFIVNPQGEPDYKKPAPCIATHAQLLDNSQINMENPTSPTLYAVNKLIQNNYSILSDTIQNPLYGALAIFFVPTSNFDTREFCFNTSGINSMFKNDPSEYTIYTLDSRGKVLFSTAPGDDIPPANKPDADPFLKATSMPDLEHTFVGIPYPDKTMHSFKQRLSLHPTAPIFLLKTFVAGIDNPDDANLIGKTIELFTGTTGTTTE